MMIMLREFGKKIIDLVLKPDAADPGSKILNAIFTFIFIIIGTLVFTVGIPFWILLIAGLAVNDFYNWIRDKFRPESDFEYVEEFKV